LPNARQRLDRFPDAYHDLGERVCRRWRRDHDDHVASCLYARAPGPPQIDNRLSQPGIDNGAQCLMNRRLV
jgi:hypothetical protein